jgi:hypothetical protein
MDPISFVFCCFFIGCIVFVGSQIRDLRKSWESDSAKLQAILAEIRDKLGK